MKKLQFGKAVKVNLARIGRTQVDLARHLCVMPQYLNSKIRNNTFTVRDIPAVVEFLGMTAAELAQDADDLA